MWLLCCRWIRNTFIKKLSTKSISRFAYLDDISIAETIMEVLYLIIGISVLIAAGFLIAFCWAVYNGQYVDRVNPSIRILFEDLAEKNKGSDHNQTPSS